MTVVHPLSSSSASATWRHATRPSASLSNTVRNSYSELWWKPGLSVSSVMPFLSGSLDGCEWTLTSPGITSRSRASISRAASPS